MKGTLNGASFFSQPHAVLGSLVALLGFFAFQTSGIRARCSGEQRPEERALSLGRQGGGERRQNRGFSRTGRLSFPCIAFSPFILSLINLD